MSKKRETIVTAAVMEMARLVRLSASPAEPGEKVPHAIARAARRLGLSKGRAASYWYGKVRSVEPEELDRARNVALRRSHDAELLRNEYKRALDLLESIKASIAALDADFYGPQIAAAREFYSRSPGLDGASPGPRDSGGDE